MNRVSIASPPRRTGDFSLKQISRSWSHLLLQERTLRNNQTNMPTDRHRDSRIANHILPTSATMTGVCVTIISTVRRTESRHQINTIIDNLLAINSLLFLIRCFLSYLSMRPLPRAACFEKYADVFFLIGFLLMVIGGFLLAWEFERL